MSDRKEDVGQPYIGGFKFAPEESTVVRGWASGKNHVAEVSPDLLTNWKRFGSEFEGFGFPVATLCRAVLRRLPVVKMTDASVDCTTCKRMSGMNGVGPRWGPGGSKETSPAKAQGDSSE